MSNWIKYAMDNIDQWIFKIIYMPLSIILVAMAFIVLTEIFKDVGWDVPFRWLMIIMIIAYIADKVVN